MRRLAGALAFIAALGVPVALSAPAVAQSCDADSIQSVSEDGAVIVLTSGAVLRVARTDRVGTAQWLSDDDFYICNFDAELLVNVGADGERASVVRVR
jgi:hypothetical protein